MSNIAPSTATKPPRKFYFDPKWIIILGIVLFVFKLVLFAVRAAWGITKVLVFIIGIPLMLLALFLTGLVTLAVPLLVISLLAAFIGPALKGK